MLNNKLCIYLDQFVLTDLMESKNGDYWFEIKSMLIEGHEKGLFFCPLSPEYYLETSKKNYSNARDHDLFFTRLSDGFGLKPELFITSQLISSRIRKNKITIRTYMYPNVGGIFKNEKNYLSFNKANNEFGYLINNCSENVNILREITNQHHIKSNLKTQLFKIVKRRMSDSFIDRLVKFQKDGYLVIKGDVFGEKEIPNWVDLIIDQLLKKHKFTKKEIAQLIIEF